MIISCDVPLKNMFGYSTELRSMTGQGRVHHGIRLHQPVTQDVQAELMAEYGRKRAAAAN